MKHGGWQVHCRWSWIPNGVLLQCFWPTRPPKTHMGVVGLRPVLMEAQRGLQLVICGSPKEAPSWWFAEASKRPSVGVSWPVSPLSGRGGTGQLVVVCGGPEEAFCWWFVTCSPTERKGRNRSINVCMRRPQRGPLLMVRGGPKEAFRWWFAEVSDEAFSGCFMTCSPTEREERNRPFGGGGCVVFGPPGPPKCVLGGGRPVRRGGGGDETGYFQWFLNLNGLRKTRLERVKPVANNFLNLIETIFFKSGRWKAGRLRKWWWWRVKHAKIVCLVCLQSKQLNVMLYMKWFGFINWSDWWIHSQHRVQMHLVAGLHCVWLYQENLWKRGFHILTKKRLDTGNTEIIQSMKSVNNKTLTRISWNHSWHPC